MMITSREYEKEFEIFSTNINGAARAYHYHVALNEAAKANATLLDVLNESPRYWLDYGYFTMQAVIILLGRVFDRNKNSHGILRLLRAAIESNYFHKDGLRIRHCWYGKEPEKLEAYLDQTHSFSSSDCYELKKFIARIRADWRKYFSRVRNKLFAHQERFSKESTKAFLLKNAKHERLKSIIDRLLIVEHIFQEAGLNGKKPDYNYVPSRSEIIAKDELKKLTDHLLLGYSLPYGDRT